MHYAPSLQPQGKQPGVSKEHTSNAESPWLTDAQSNSSVKINVPTMTLSEWEPHPSFLVRSCRDGFCALFLEKAYLRGGGGHLENPQSHLFFQRVVTFLSCGSRIRIPELEL